MRTSILYCDQCGKLLRNDTLFFKDPDRNNRIVETHGNTYLSISGEINSWDICGNSWNVINIKRDQFNDLHALCGTWGNLHFCDEQCLLDFIKRVKRENNKGELK